MSLYNEGEEIVDFESSEPAKANTVTLVFCILGYVGNGLLVLLFLMVLGMKDVMIKEISRQNKNMVIDADMLNFIIWFMILFCLGSIAGLIGIQLKKLWGLIVYLTFGGIWTLFCFVSLDPSSIVLGLVSIAFMIVLSLNYKK